MATMPILVFHDWKKQFHVHVSMSSVALGIVLAQAGEGTLDHPIDFSSRKLPTIEREGLAMVYVLQNF